MRNQVLAGVLGIAAALAGCSSGGSDRGEEAIVVHHDGSKETITREPGLATNREEARGGRMVIEDRVPSTAREIQEPAVLADGTRRDGGLVARPTADGQVWVVDARTARILYTGQMQAGHELFVNPARDEITLNARPVQTKPLPRDGVFKIYFLPG